MSGRVPRAELAILEIRYRPVAPETEPHSAPLSQYDARLLTSQLRPRDLLDQTTVHQVQKTPLF